MKELNHLADIFEKYDTFIIDLWGVMHNGVSLNPSAIEAVDQLKKHSKKIVFLSNAPRPSLKVINFLIKMKMDKRYLENVMTSGEAAMYAINQNKFGKKFAVTLYFPKSLFSSEKLLNSLRCTPSVIKIESIFKLLAPFISVLRLSPIAKTFSFDSKHML